MYDHDKTTTKINHLAARTHSGLRIPFIQTTFKVVVFKAYCLEWTEALIANLDLECLKKPSHANFLSIRGNQWCLTAYCDFPLMTHASDFQPRR